VLALIQRVSRACVRIDQQVVGEIGAGLLTLVAIERGDHDELIGKMLHKLLNYRVFSDDAGKMNRSLKDIDGGLLLVSQFTLAADTQSGLRPSFTPAAPPEIGLTMFCALVTAARAAHTKVASGQFGADMHVELINDGPVTFMLQVK
jgi:D-aminoacyl-tRNA deacylase